jgi:hypothetical protein
MKKIWPAIIALTVAVLGAYLALVPLQQSLSGDGALASAPRAIPAPTVADVSPGLEVRGGPASSTFVAQKRVARPKTVRHHRSATHHVTPVAQAPAARSTFVRSTPTPAAPAHATRPATAPVTRSRSMIGASTATQGSGFAGAGGSSSRSVVGGSSGSPG